jgi:hypothetical protein
VHELSQKVQDAYKRKGFTMRSKKGGSLQASENNPFQALMIWQPRFPRNIPMQTWENHFSKMLNKHETAFAATKDHPIPVLNPFTESKTSDIIADTKNNKAAGPDGIYNEHLKTSHLLLLRVWTSMFNKCMSLGTIPDGWRKLTIKILFKGKGDLSDLDSYRVTALECTPFYSIYKTPHTKTHTSNG